MPNIQDYLNQWGAVMFFVLLYGSFLIFIPFYKKMDKKPAVTYLAFIIAFAIEMHGIPFSMYLIAWGLFGIISLLLALALMVIILSGIVALVFVIIKEDFIASKIFRKSLLWGLALLVLAATQVLMSEYYTYIPETSEIAYEEKVTLNDSEQYITVRGTDENNPIILFFAGGPGGSQVQATREHLKGLEEDFTIVTWE
ncbi:MAG: hypothetical protein PF513_06770 [Tenericutes bacterium]|jgi:FlaA1/EpsC-like NDP-sugar epimerase|nr:hypothetical protein [Mycoplasmatota bacterium]